MVPTFQMIHLTGLKVPHLSLFQLYFLYLLFIDSFCRVEADRYSAMTPALFYIYFNTPYVTYYYRRVKTSVCILSVRRWLECRAICLAWASWVKSLRLALKASRNTGLNMYDCSGFWWEAQLCGFIYVFLLFFFTVNSSYVGRYL